MRRHGDGEAHDHGLGGDQTAGLFEPPAWGERHAVEELAWSGRTNPRLVAEVSSLTPGTALDVGCGEGGDVIWLVRQGWRVIGSDSSAHGLGVEADGPRRLIDRRGERLPS